MNFKNYVITGIIGLLTLLLSCGDKVYEGDTIINEGGNANIETVITRVYKNDWVWNDKEKRYEFIQDVAAITADIVDWDAVIAYLFVDENNVRVVKNLPYEREHTNENDDIYTTRIAYDISKSNIAFYIEDSDRFKDEGSLQDYEFKIVIVSLK